MNLSGLLVSVTEVAATETPREGQDGDAEGQERSDRQTSSDTFLTFPCTGLLTWPAYYKQRNKLPMDRNASQGAGHALLSGALWGEGV